MPIPNVDYRFQTANIAVANYVASRAVGAGALVVGGQPRLVGGRLPPMSFASDSLSATAAGFTDGHINGIYTASASSAEGGAPQLAFVQGNSTGWRSAPLYSSADGGYTGVSSTAALGSLGAEVSVLGEWLQLSVPASLRTSRYIIGPLHMQSDALPRSWTLLGSPDGATWYVLDVRTDEVWSGSTTRSFTVNDSGDRPHCMHFRLVARAKRAAGSQQQVAIGTLSFIAAPEVRMRQDPSVPLSSTLHVAGDVEVGGSVSMQAHEVLRLASGSNLTVGVAAGNVGIGTDAPQYKLHVVGDIFASGDISAFSDARKKTNIKRIDNALEKVLSLNGYTFQRVEDGDGGRLYMGILAQEAERVVPEVVAKDGDGFLSVAYGNIVGLLIEAVRDLKNSVDAQATAISMQPNP